MALIRALILPTLSDENLPDGGKAFQIIGSSTVPVTDIYVQNDVHVTSDVTWKDIVGTVSENDALMGAWGTLSYKLYQMKAAVAEKGADEARIHAGLIAQDIITAFTDAGLDWTRYGLISLEEWDAGRKR